HDLTLQHVLYSLHFLMRQHPRPTLFPYTTLFRSGSKTMIKIAKQLSDVQMIYICGHNAALAKKIGKMQTRAHKLVEGFTTQMPRSEEHTSELQSRENLVCRLLLEKKKHKE